MRDSEVWRSWPAPEPGVDLYDWQDGRCAWCGSDRTSRLVRDHCHMTGLIRGLLCDFCNSAESRTASDSPEWEAWRTGDHPAAITGTYEVYVSATGATPIEPSSALSYYSWRERKAWWAETLSALANGAEWPREAPWTPEVTERRDAAQRHAMEVLNEIFSRPKAGA